MDPYLYYYWAAVSFSFGLIVGSFLNVVIARLPMEESLVFPPSKCPRCDTPIHWYDNIPVLSYLALMGRCRHCGNPISFRYPLVELIAGGLALALYVKLGLTPALPVFAIFTAAMIVVCFIDLDHMIIPDAISLNCVPIGMSAAILGLIPGVDWKYSFMGTGLGVAALYIPAFLYELIRGDEGLGGGDIKLLGMIGAFTGPYGVVFVLFVSSITGSIVGIAAMILNQSDSATRIPFGPFLSGAAVLYVLSGPELIVSFLTLWLRAFGGLLTG